MTIRELKQKLELYNDDVEVYVPHYDDLHGMSSFYSPAIFQQDVYSWKNKKGYDCLSSVRWRSEDTKKVCVLVIE